MNQTNARARAHSTRAASHSSCARLCAPRSGAASAPLQPRRSNAEASPSVSAEAESLAAVSQRCEDFRRVAADLQLENAALRKQAALVDEQVARMDELELLVTGLREDNLRLRAENVQLRGESVVVAPLGPSPLSSSAQESGSSHDVASDIASSRLSAASARRLSVEVEVESPVEDKENYSPVDGRRAEVLSPLTALSEARVFNVLSEREVSDAGSEYGEESEGEAEGVDAEGFSPRKESAAVRARIAMAVAAEDDDDDFQIWKDGGTSAQYVSGRRTSKDPPVAAKGTAGLAIDLDASSSDDDAPVLLQMTSSSSNASARESRFPLPTDSPVGPPILPSEETAAPTREAIDAKLKHT